MAESVGAVAESHVGKCVFMAGGDGQVYLDRII